MKAAARSTWGNFEADASSAAPKVRSTQKSRAAIGNPGRREKLKKIELLRLTSQLSIMIRAGMELADAVHQISQRAKSPRIKRCFERIHDDIQEGRQFSEALRRQESAFGSSYVASVSAGETSGQLVNVLSRLSELLRNDLRIQSAIRGALTYPVVLTVISSFVVAALLVFVLPQFDKVFTNLGAPVPFITQVLLEIGTFCRKYIIIELITLVVASVGMYKCWRFPAFVRFRDRILFETPWLRDGMRDLVSGRVFSLLGTMIQSGVPVLEAIQISRYSVRNVVFHELFEEIEKVILGGGSIGGLLGSAKCIPDGAAEMIATAEKSGELGTVMSLVGSFYEEEGGRKLREQVKLLEPIIIVVMGVFVAMIVASVMIPLFDISSTASY